MFTQSKILYLRSLVPLVELAPLHLALILIRFHRHDKLIHTMANSVHKEV